LKAISTTARLWWNGDQTENPARARRPPRGDPRARPPAVRADPAKPLHDRVAATIENWLDWLDANSETWLATAAQGDYIADPDLQALVDTARDRTVDALITDYPDALTHDRRTRLMLRNWLGFNRASARSWLTGEATRAETALQLAETLHHLITTVAPALTNLAGNDDAAR
jgi:hypothetical protein